MLHRSVKQLQHDRHPRESAAGMAVNLQLSPMGKAPKLTHQFNPGRTAFPVVPVEVEQIDIGVPDKFTLGELWPMTKEGTELPLISLDDTSVKRRREVKQKREKKKAKAIK
ncbi:hypothetical protein ACFX1Q_029906 [Malus domestica]